MKSNFAASHQQSFHDFLRPGSSIFLPEIHNNRGLFHGEMLKLTFLGTDLCTLRFLQLVLSYVPILRSESSECDITLWRFLVIIRKYSFDFCLDLSTILEPQTIIFPVVKTFYWEDVLLEVSWTVRRFISTISGGGGGGSGYETLSFIWCASAGVSVRKVGPTIVTSHFNVQAPWWHVLLPSPASHVIYGKLLVSELSLSVQYFWQSIILIIISYIFSKLYSFIYFPLI